MTNKTVVITGAGTGIGKALSRVFFKNEWNTVAPTHKELDVTNQISIDTFIHKLQDKPIDVLINNAGLYDDYLEAERNNIEKIIQLFRVNTVGAAILSNLLSDNLLMGSEKLVISISSVMSTHSVLRSYYSDHWAYGASKMALNYAMIYFANAHPQLKSVLIHPGWVKTKMGGKGAILDPEFSAEKIFELIRDHKHRLQNKKLIDYTGKIMDF